jgi:fibronectin type 3 domain-containing protein
VSSFGQTNITQFDALKFYESEKTPQMVYIKWFSTGNNPAPDFMPVQYQDKQAVKVHSITMRYPKNDTVFYVLQDTLMFTLPTEEYLQYFIAALDTSGKAYNTSDIVKVPASKPENLWFVMTEATQSKKEKSIMLQWKMSNLTDIKLFEIYRSQFLDKDFKLLVTLPAIQQHYTDLETTPDVMYYYRLSAIRNSGNQPIQSNAIFSASYNPNPPIPPYIEMATGIKGGVSLRIQVTDTEAAGVRIYRDNGITPELKLVSDLVTLTPDAPSVVWFDTLSVLSGRRTYTYAAKTESTSFVESEFSNKAYARPLITVPPNGPASFTAYEEDRVVKLFWENMEEEDIAIAGYRLFRKSDGPTSDFIELTPNGEMLENNYFTDSTALAGQTYTYKVNTMDIDGNISLAGTITTVSLQANKPIVPFALVAFSIDEGIQLEWGQTIDDDLKSLVLYRRTEGEKPRAIITLPPETLEFLDQEVEPGKQYFYSLTTKNKADVESEPSEEKGVIR